jgi:hypothetical protein
MWVGRGFDTDGDGDNDFMMWQKLPPVSAADMGKAIALIVTACTVLAVGFALVVGVQAVISWFSANWWWFLTMVFYAGFGLVCLLALGVLALGIASQSRR